MYDAEFEVDGEKLSALKTIEWLVERVERLESMYINCLHAEIRFEKDNEFEEYE